MSMYQSKKSFTQYCFYPWVVVVLASSFLFYKYILQVSPSIMIDELMREFHVHGAGLGDLAASFFYSLLIAQFFVGVLLDKYSPRLLTTLAILLCALGVYAFSKTESLLWAKWARILMGVGAAFATVSYMKMTSLWFKPNQFAFVGGLLASAAMLGAIAGQAPLAWIVDQVGWRSGMTMCAVVGVVLAALFYLLMNDKPPTRYPCMASNTTAALVSWRDVCEVLNKQQNWLITLYSGLAFSPIDAFAGLWGISFLKQGYLLTQTQAAVLISFIFLGLALGSPLLGLLSNCFGQRRNVMLVSALVAFVTLTATIYVTHLPLWLLSSLLFLFGFSTGAFMLGFVVGSEINKITVTATIVALINTGDIIFSAFTEPLIGKLLDSSWSGKIMHGVHYFSTLEYRNALMLLPLYILLATILLLFIREPSVS